MFVSWWLIDVDTNIVSVYLFDSLLQSARVKQQNPESAPVWYNPNSRKQKPSYSHINHKCPFHDLRMILNISPSILNRFIQLHEHKHKHKPTDLRLPWDAPVSPPPTPARLWETQGSWVFGIMCSLASSYTHMHTHTHTQTPNHHPRLHPCAFSPLLSGNCCPCL